MGIGFRLKEIREHKGLTRTELANRIGVTASAISNYENNISSPKEAILISIMTVLECDANYLFQDEMKKFQSTFTPTCNEMSIIKKYRSLDESGKRTVDMIIEDQYKRCMGDRDAEFSDEVC